MAHDKTGRLFPWPRLARFRMCVHGHGSLVNALRAGCPDGRRERPVARSSTHPDKGKGLPEHPWGCTRDVEPGEGLARNCPMCTPPTLRSGRKRQPVARRGHHDRSGHICQLLHGPRRIPRGLCQGQPPLGVVWGANLARRGARTLPRPHRPRAELFRRSSAGPKKNRGPLKVSRYLISHRAGCLPIVRAESDPVSPHTWPGRIQSPQS